MDALRSAIGLAPLAAYLFVLGWVNLSRRPKIKSGARDLAALGVAISGLMIVGPFELLMPGVLIAQMGPLAWGMVIAIYASGWTLLVLSVAPRLVAYNISAEQFRALVAETASRLDSSSHWAGDALVMPKRGLQGRIESFPIFRNVSLVANGSNQDYGAWRDLEIALRKAMTNVVVARSPRGAMMVVLAVVIATVLVFRWAGDPQVAQNFVDMIGL